MRDDLDFRVLSLCSPLRSWARFRFGAGAVGFLPCGFGGVCNKCRRTRFGRFVAQRRAAVMFAALVVVASLAARVGADSMAAPEPGDIVCSTQQSP
jgi:hypothetical protein